MSPEESQSIRPSPSLTVPFPARVIGLVLILLYLAAASAQEKERMTVAGLERSYSLHLPVGYDGEAGPYPLVVMLHGRFGDGERMRGVTGFDEVADAHGLIVAYPDALGGEWNYTRSLPGWSAPDHDDGDFLLRLVEALSAEYRVDQDRVYLVGFSNGGFLTQRIACERPDAFAAYATVAAAGFAGLPALCGEAAPLAIILVHGTADSNIPWEGLQIELPDGGRAPLLTSVPQTFAFWAGRADCVPASERTSIAPRGNSPGTYVDMLRVSDCAGNGEVVLVAVVGGGHNWPGRDTLDPAMAGAVNLDVDAGELIWAFFERHPRE